MGEEPGMTFVYCVKHDLADDVEDCENCHYEMTVKQLRQYDREVLQRVAPKTLLEESEAGDE